MEELLARQEATKKMIAEDSCELMRVYDNGGRWGTVGTDPEQFTASAEIQAINRYTSYRDEDLAYHYLPDFGFHFSITRTIISPYSYFDKNHGVSITTKNSSGHPGGTATLWFTLGDYDFFSVLDAVRIGDRFAHFSVRGEETTVQALSGFALVGGSGLAVRGLLQDAKKARAPFTA